jgi:hypothetical protein
MASTMEVAKIGSISPGSIGVATTNRNNLFSKKQFIKITNSH